MDSLSSNTIRYIAKNSNTHKVKILLKRSFRLTCMVYDKSYAILKLIDKATNYVLESHGSLDKPKQIMDP